MYMKSSSSGTRAASTNARGMPSAWAALNNMCNLSNGWARRHGEGDVMTSMYKSMCGETGVSFLSFSMRSVCVLSILSVKSFLFGVVCPISSIRCLRDIIRARAAHSTSSLSLPANSTWLQVTHTACARSTWERRSMHSRQLEGAGCPHCDFLPMHVLRSRKGSSAFPAVLVPLPLRRNGIGARGVRKWICWREWRRASPYLLSTHQIRRSF